jgi:hypothetical protein
MAPETTINDLEQLKDRPEVARPRSLGCCNRQSLIAAN